MKEKKNNSNAIIENSKFTKFGGKLMNRYRIIIEKLK